MNSTSSLSVLDNPQFILPASLKHLIIVTVPSRHLHIVTQENGPSVHNLTGAGLNWTSEIDTQIKSFFEKLRSQSIADFWSFGSGAFFIVAHIIAAKCGFTFWKNYTRPVMELDPLVEPGNVQHSEKPLVALTSLQTPPDTKLEESILRALFQNNLSKDPHTTVLVINTILGKRIATFVGQLLGIKDVELYPINDVSAEMHFVSFDINNKSVSYSLRYL